MAVGMEVEVKEAVAMEVVMAEGLGVEMEEVMGAEVRVAVVTAVEVRVAVGWEVGMVEDLVGGKEVARVVEAKVVAAAEEGLEGVKEEARVAVAREVEAKEAEEGKEVAAMAEEMGESWVVVAEVGTAVEAKVVVRVAEATAGVVTVGEMVVEMG